MYRNYQRRQGITLIEVLFVLGIMAILIGIVMYSLSSVNSRNKENQLFEEIYQIKSIMVDLCTNNLDACKTDIIQPIAKSGLLPSKYIKNGTIIDPYGSPLLQVVPININFTGSGTDAISVVLTINNISECNAILQRLMDTPVESTIKQQGNITPSLLVGSCKTLTYPTQSGFIF